MEADTRQRLCVEVDLPAPVLPARTTSKVRPAASAPAVSAPSREGTLPSLGVVRGWGPSGFCFIRRHKFAVHHAPWSEPSAFEHSQLRLNEGDEVMRIFGRNLGVL